MDKILEALKALLPDGQGSDLAAKVEEYLAEAEAKIEQEYEAKLEAAYEKVNSEKEEAEKVAETGYAQAYGIIQELRDRMDRMKEEYDSVQDAGYHEAYSEIEKIKAEKEKLESELYGVYDKRLQDMQEHMVEKVNEFLTTKGAEIYNTARRDFLNDPRLAEHKLTLEKILDIVVDYASDEDVLNASSAKLAEANQAVDKLKYEKKILEGKNVRLQMENTNLTEQVKQASHIISEAQKTSKKEVLNERTEKATNASPKGRVAFNPKEEEIIKESVDSNKDETPRFTSNPDTLYLAGVGANKQK